MNCDFLWCLHFFQSSAWGAWTLQMEGRRIWTISFLPSWLEPLWLSCLTFPDCQWSSTASLWWLPIARLTSLGSSSCTGSSPSSHIYGRFCLVWTGILTDPKLFVEPSKMTPTKINCFRHYASRDGRSPNRILKVRLATNKNIARIANAVQCHS